MKKMEKLKEVIEQVKEYEDNNCFELKTSVVLHWLKEIENEALAISRVVGQSEQLPTDRDKIEALINHLEPKFKESEKS